MRRAIERFYERALARPLKAALEPPIKPAQLQQFAPRSAARSGCAAQVQCGTLLAAEGAQMTTTSRASVKKPARKTFCSSAAPLALGLRSATC